MRKGSLFIELRGNYSNGEFENYEHLAKMFGVFYSYVVTSNLNWHKATAFNLTLSEAEQVVEIIKRYNIMLLINSNYN